MHKPLKRHPHPLLNPPEGSFHFNNVHEEIAIYSLTLIEQSVQNKKTKKHKKNKNKN
jgi:hypothetical protein